MESLYSAISIINIRRLVNDKCVVDPIQSKTYTVMRLNKLLI